MKLLSSFKKNILSPPVGSQELHPRQISPTRLHDLSKINGKKATRLGSTVYNTENNRRDIL